CIEVPIDEIIGCRRSLFHLRLVCKESESDIYFIELIPRKSAKEFLGELLNIDMRCKVEREIFVPKPSKRS
ncbi:MAG: hypothetical protein JSV09_03415, partial [Thermoplasmata archaeon]